jgi:hypothetical protein
MFWRKMVHVVNMQMIYFSNEYGKDQNVAVLKAAY